jgi:hypothetical protein
MLRRYFVALSCALLLIFLGMGTKANAQPVHFRYTGGPWSHHYHAGWHRYWGGPSIGFYYAPAPVYLVSGYSAPYYYSGPSFWYSNPSFGLSLNFGGGGGYYAPRYHRAYGAYGGWHGGGRVSGWHGGGRVGGWRGRGRH